MIINNLHFLEPVSQEPDIRGGLSDFGSNTPSQNVTISQQGTTIANGNNSTAIAQNFAAVSQFQFAGGTSSSRPKASSLDVTVPQQATAITNGNNSTAIAQNFAIVNLKAF